MEGGDGGMRLQGAILSQLAAIQDALTRPKKIVVKRGKDGKIESASAGQ
jgi:hypothetical protein